MAYSVREIPRHLQTPNSRQLLAHVNSNTATIVALIYGMFYYWNTIFE